MLRDRRQITILGVAAAMTVGFVLFCYMPLHKSRKAVVRAKSERLAVISSAAAQADQLPRLKAQLDLLNNQVQNYRLNVPTDRDLGSFLNEIAALMTEHRLKEPVVQPGKEIQTDRLNAIPLTISCKGGLSQIFQFYSSLGKLNRSIRIEQVELSGSDDFTGQAAMKTEAVIYYEPRTLAGIK